MGVDSGSLQEDSQPKMVGLISDLATTWHWVHINIVWTEWTLIMALQW